MSEDRTQTRMEMEQLAAIVQEQQAQIQALVAAQQQQPGAAAGQPHRRVAGQKITQFGNEAGESWLGWRDSFENTVALNGYNDLEQRLALSGAMKGKAKLATMDIRVQEPIDGAPPTIALVLGAYQERFMPAAASHLARTKFELARQGPQEEILDFHSRLRALYTQAYPNAADDTMLIRRFVGGLRRRELRMQAMRTDPQTYPAALASAQHEASVQQQSRLAETGTAPGGDDPMEIDSIDRRTSHATNGRAGKERGPRPPTDRGVRGLCHFCQQPGHYKRDCELRKKSQKFQQGNYGKGGSQRRALVAALEATLTGMPAGEDGGGSSAATGAEETSDF